MNKSATMKKVEFKPFDWLNLDSLLESHSYKFELHSNRGLSIEEFQHLIDSLFENYYSEIVVGLLGYNVKWGDFCIDTWDFENDKSDYSFENKSDSCSNYLKMLIENKIDPEFTGFCQSNNWDNFLSIILNCILSHTAPYSPMFYIPEDEFVFYVHHSGSFGVYYNELNESIRQIVKISRLEGLEIRYNNDERLVTIG